MGVIKELAYRLFVAAGVTSAAAWLNRRKAVILAYHDV